MPPQESKKPNILYFHVDNISVGNFGCYGGAYPIGPKTPNIERHGAKKLSVHSIQTVSECVSPTGRSTKSWPSNSGILSLRLSLERINDRISDQNH
jgi:hypothetical protein